MHEMSMNFDLENVQPFLSRISPFFDGGFGPSEITKAYEFTKSVAHDDEKEIEFTVDYKGKQEKMIYRVFMDDIDSPDIYFFTTSNELAEEIGNEYDKMCEKLGI